MEYYYCDVYLSVHCMEYVEYSLNYRTSTLELIHKSIIQ